MDKGKSRQVGRTVVKPCILSIPYLCSSTYELQNLEDLQHWSMKIRGALHSVELQACECHSGAWVHEWAREHQAGWFLLACFPSFLLFFFLFPPLSLYFILCILFLPSYRATSHIFLDNWVIGKIFTSIALNKITPDFFPTLYIMFLNIRKW